LAIKQELTAHQKALIEHVENSLRHGPFVDRDFSHYGSRFIDTLKETIHEVQRERYQRVIEVEDAARIKRRQKADEYRPKLTEWAIENLKPGMHVKMRGCRDGHGLREIIELKTETRGYGRMPTIVCWQLDFKFWVPRKNELPDQKPIRMNRTEHLMDKILGIAKITAAEDVAYQGEKRFTYEPIKKIIAESEDK
jgi:hypothetical protein